MIADKVTFAAGTVAQLIPQRIVPAITMPLESYDFSQLRGWLDNPIAQTLTAVGFHGRDLVIMGPSAKTPYNPTWQEQDARAALFAQIAVSPAAS